MDLVTQLQDYNDAILKSFTDTFDHISQLNLEISPVCSDNIQAVNEMADFIRERAKCIYTLYAEC